jgi:hypothetical protein
MSIPGILLSQWYASLVQAAGFEVLNVSVVYGYGTFELQKTQGECFAPTLTETSFFFDFFLLFSKK